jgi:hypothetical protein
MFKVGDKVEVRDDPAQIWMSGVVHSLQSDGRPRVMRDGKHQAFPFNEVCVHTYIYTLMFVAFSPIHMIK